ncbi:MAG: DnaB-like helicase C-terminal domain-containing protein [Parabacteroides sp.]|nr:DnaB-like helicase C-terminal domain-containing protein [Parabacteroides sp.]
MNNNSFKQSTASPAILALPEEMKAEKALLFGLLASHKNLAEIAFRVRPEMFTQPDIALAIEAYLNLHEKGEGTDILSVEKEIRRLSPERAKLLPNLFTLSRQDGYLEVGDEYVRAHCQHIREAFVARQLILKCQEMTHKAATDDRDTRMLIAELGDVADDLGGQLSLTHEIPDMPTATAEAMARVREIRERVSSGGTPGIYTGLGQLDKLTGGLQDGSLHVFAARPGMGKTAFALFMAVNAAKQGMPVCIYSLEMSREQLLFRILGQIAHVEPSKINKGTTTEDEMKALEEASRLLESLPILINQRSDIRIDEIYADVALRKRQGKCALVIIDYLQLMNRDDKGKTPNEAISAIPRKTKIMAMDERIPVVLLCQLNRNCETRGANIKYQLSDLRDSGSIEQDADTVAFISRLAVINIQEDPETRQSTQGRGTILLAKNRHGEIGQVRFMHDEGMTTFWDDLQQTPPGKPRNTASKPKGKDLFEC